MLNIELTGKELFNHFNIHWKQEELKYFEDNYNMIFQVVYLEEHNAALVININDTNLIVATTPIQNIQTFIRFFKPSLEDQLHEMVNKYGTNDRRTIKVSQELDKLVCVLHELTNQKYFKNN